jgi:hypothetical protein
MNTAEGTPTTEELEAQIAAQRDHLADTVDQLSHKLDVKEQARVRLQRVQQRVQQRVRQRVRQRVQPRQVVMVVGLGVVVGALVWWRRS